MINVINLIRRTLPAIALAGTMLHADVYTLSAPHYVSNPGSVVMVPISLDNAAGLAGIRVQVNYDPQVLLLTGVQPGPLGAEFDLSHEITEGTVTMDLVRDTALASGGGRLVMLRFITNSGATTDLYSDVSLAQFEIGDESGVRDLTVVHRLATSNGSVRVSLADNIDNGSNGLPDWWELQYGLDMSAAASGQDGDDDGLNNLLEYAMGGDPRTPDHGLVAPFPSVEKIDGHRYLTLTFCRRKPPVGLIYLLQESDELVVWSSIDPDLRLVEPPIDIDDEMESVTVRGELPLDAPLAPVHSFMRVEVKPKP